jgi:hypothetical protein
LYKNAITPAVQLVFWWALVIAHSGAACAPIQANLCRLIDDDNGFYVLKQEYTTYGLYREYK